MTELEKKGGVGQVHELLYKKEARELKKENRETSIEK